MLSGQCFVISMVGGQFLFQTMNGGQYHSQCMVNDQWFMVSGLWSATGWQLMVLYYAVY